MTIRHLKIFIAVATCGKMRLAAENLYISQPAVSQAIKELESYYHVTLFERLSHRLYLTEEGKKLLSHARYVVDSFDNLDLMMRKQGTAPLLRVGGSVSVGTYLLNDILDKMEHHIKDLQFKVIINNTSMIEELIKTSELDIALIEGALSYEELVQIPIYEDELVVIVGKGHPLFTTETITLDELENQVWISREEGSMTRNQYEQLLLEKQYTIKHKWIFSNTEAIKQAVIRGRGIAIISKMLIQKELASGELRILPVEHITVTRPIKLVYHKDKYLSEYLTAFIHICKNMDFSS